MKKKKKTKKQCLTCLEFQYSIQQHKEILTKNRYFINRMHNLIMGKQVKLIRKAKNLHHQATQNRNMYEIQKMLNLIKASNK